MNKVRQIRQEKGLNQRQLAEKSHTAQSLVSSIERGVMKPWPKVLHRLARTLGVSETELFPTEEGGQDGQQ